MILYIGTGWNPDKDLIENTENTNNLANKITDFC